MGGAVQSQPAAVQPEHRPDIDGLRAVAILTVLVFHAWEQVFPGGYIGVDLFFVISGFLISGIVFKALRAGSFSFLDFYLRRIKRIFPALFLVLTAVWIAAWLWLLPDEFIEVGKHIASGAAFTANVALWTEAGYFDRLVELKPLLHLWSLGVEEQFYLFWPALAVLAWKWRLHLLNVTLAVALVSFALNVALVHSHETAVFYLPATRIWEILAGSALAYYKVFKWQVLGPRMQRHGNVLAAAGALLVILSVVGLDKGSFFPGWVALLPTVGAVLLIAAGMNAWINRVVLGSRPMVFVGLISYPLYLWHWPLLSFQRILFGEGVSVLARCAVLALAFLLAWLTYRLVEVPVRSRHPGTAVAGGLFAGVACVGVVGYLSFANAINPRSASYPELAGIETAVTASAFPGINLKPLVDAAGEFRRQGANARTVLVIGDSNVQQYYPRIDQVISNNPNAARSVVFASYGGCSPFPNLHGAHHRFCEGLLERAIAYARRPEVDTVLIAAHWMAYFRPRPRYEWYFDDGASRRLMTLDAPSLDLAFGSLQNMIAAFISQGKQVYIVLQMPHGTRFDPRSMVARRWLAPAFQIEPPRIPRSEVAAEMEPIVNRLRQVAAATGARTIDPMRWLCTDAACSVLTDDGVPVYQDAAHLNPVYVRDRIRYLDEVFLEPQAEIRAVQVRPPQQARQQR